MSGGSSGSHSVQTGHTEMPVSLALASFMGGPGTLGKQGDMKLVWIKMIYNKATLLLKEGGRKHTLHNIQGYLS